MDRLEGQWPRPKLDRADQLESPTYLSEKIFKVYKEANLMYPQRGFGIIAMTADALLSDADFDIKEFAKTTWSPDQILEIKTAMNRAHPAHGVKAGSPEHEQEITEKVKEVKSTEQGIPNRPFKRISDERLQELWTSFKGAITDSLGAAAAPDIPIPYVTSGGEEQKVRTDYANAVNPYLQDPETAREIREIFSSFAKTLRSPEGRDMSKQIKQAIRDKEPYRVESLYVQLRSMAWRRLREDTDINVSDERFGILKRELNI
jgi:hypothetical protein